MAFPTGTETTTTLAEIIPEIWGSRLNDFYKSKLVMGGFFTDRSDELAGGADALYTPSVTEMSANTKSNAAAVTLNAPTETKVTLTVDTWTEVSFAIEDKEAAQVKKSYSIQETYAKNAGYTVAKVLETAIATLFASFTGSVGASTQALLDSDIRKAIGILEAANIDTSSETAFFIDSKVFWVQVQDINKFALATNAPSQDPVMKRPATYLYGIPVFVSNNIQYVASTTGRTNALAHKDAIHYATLSLGGASGVRVQSNYIPEYLSTVTTADMVYGTVMNRAASGVKILTSAVA